MKLSTVFKAAVMGTLAVNSFTTTAEAAISKNQRRLLVVSNLTTFGQAKYEWLYKFLDASTISMAKTFLSSKYSYVHTLTPSNATKANFQNSLKSITNASSVKGVDVILSLHGASNALWFKDGGYSTANVQSGLQTLPNRSKFRLMYNLACYGSSHRNEFINAGFRTAIGSRKTNTSSASEYPEFLTRYGMGHSVNSIIASSNSNPGMGFSDAAAGMMGFSDADSYKLISGVKTLTINHNAK